MSKLCSTDFYQKTPFNVETQTQIWMSQIADSHDNFCHCCSPFAHLLASIFPPGHQDRVLTIDQILERDFQQICRGGGTEERSGGEADTNAAAVSTNIKGQKEDTTTAEDLAFAAAAGAAEENIR